MFSSAEDITGTISPSRELTLASQIEASAQEKGKAMLESKKVHSAGIKRLPKIDYVFKATITRKGVVVTELWPVKTVEEMNELIAKRDGQVQTSEETSAPAIAEAIAQTEVAPLPVEEVRKAEIVRMVPAAETPIKVTVPEPTAPPFPATIAEAVQSLPEIEKAGPIVPGETLLGTEPPPTENEMTAPVKVEEKAAPVQPVAVPTQTPSVAKQESAPTQINEEARLRSTGVVSTKDLLPMSSIASVASAAKQQLAMGVHPMEASSASTQTWSEMKSVAVMEKADAQRQANTASTETSGESNMLIKNAATVGIGIGFLIMAIGGFGLMQNWKQHQLKKSLKRVKLTNVVDLTLTRAIDPIVAKEIAQPTKKIDTLPKPREIKMDVKEKESVDEEDKSLQKKNIPLLQSGVRNSVHNSRGRRSKIKREASWERKSPQLVN